jgi:hypothetical protein
VGYALALLWKVLVSRILKHMLAFRYLCQLVSLWEIWNQAARKLDQSHQAPALLKILEQSSNACSTSDDLHAIIDPGAVMQHVRLLE